MNDQKSMELWTEMLWCEHFQVEASTDKVLWATGIAL